MRRGVGSVLFALTAIGPIGAAMADVPVYKISVDRGARFGTAFAVHDWRSSQRGTLLVTALHVVHRASSIAIEAIDCGGASARRRTQLDRTLTSGEVIVWPAYDLAAIVVTPDQMPKLFADIQSQGGPGDIKLDERGRPDVSTPIAVPGFSSNSDCADGAGIVTGYVTALLHAQDVALKLHREVEEVLASMDPTAIWLEYTNGQSTPGTSGAPIFEKGSRVVVGIHLQCYPNSAVCWGLLLKRGAAAASPTDQRPNRAAGAMLTGEGKGQLATADWPPVRWPDRRVLAAAFNVRMADAPVLAQRWRLNRSPWSAGMFFEHTAGSWSASTPWSFGLLWKLGSELEHFGGAAHTFSIGSALSAGGRLGFATERLRTPGGDDMRQANTMLWDVLFELLPIELRMFRLSSIRPSLAVGFRAGVSFSGEPTGELANPRVPWGPTAHLRIAFSLPGNHGPILDIGLAREHSPATDWVYTGIRGAVERRPAEWTWLVSAGVAYGS